MDRRRPPFGYRLDDERRHLEPDPAEAAVVREIFARYAERLEGAQTIGRWLSERGYRTKNGKPFNPQAVLTILRNRAYLGEIFFRGTYHPAPHEPLIDRPLFERAQAILEERGEDHSLRRSNTSDYLLTGLVKCARCGKRYIGAAANGNGGRYRYYVCFSRQRYGRGTCDAQSLPADELEQAILDQLADLLSREDEIRAEIEKAFAELDADKPRREAELARLDAELRKTNDTIDRYFHAFEHGTMPEKACAPRIAKLTQRLSELEARHAELAAADDENQPEPLSDKRPPPPPSARRRGDRRWRPTHPQGTPASPRPRNPGRQPRRDLPVLQFARGSTTIRVSAPGRIRTSDPRLRRPPLCPLSYGRPGGG